MPARDVRLPRRCAQWLDHRRDVLVRRSRHRLGRDRAPARSAGRHAHRLPQSRRGDPHHPRGGRAEGGDEGAVRTHRQSGQRRFSTCGCARLRRLEEMQLRNEHDELRAKRRDLDVLVGDEAKQWKTITAQIREIKKKCGPLTGARQAPHHIRGAARDVRGYRSRPTMIEREPVTVIVSREGLDSRAQGPCRRSRHRSQFKGDDALEASFFAETTVKILVLATNGKIFTLDAAKLPGGRGSGEPIRLMADIEEGADIVAVFSIAPGSKMLVAASDGRGFIVTQDEMISSNPQGQGAAQRRSRRPGPRSHRRRPRAIMSRRSARTASCWSFR